MLNSADLRQRLREAAETGKFRILDYARRMLEKRGFIDTDVVKALKSGQHMPLNDAIVDGQWRYRWVGKTL